MGRVRDLNEIARRHGLPSSYVRAHLPLAFLAPSMISAMLEGRQPADLSLKQVMYRTNLALDWTQQRRQLGFDRWLSFHVGPASLNTFAVALCPNCQPQFRQRRQGPESGPKRPARRRGTRDHEWRGRHNPQIYRTYSGSGRKPTETAFSTGLAGCAGSRVRTRLHKTQIPCSTGKYREFQRKQRFPASRRCEKPRQLSFLAVEFPTRGNREFFTSEQGNMRERSGVRCVGYREAHVPILREPFLGARCRQLIRKL